ncbi:pyrroline-5-carboxylate reductase family protein [Tropicibacter alexandrii]|uniref:pyrroline-5-carboxylate reductase family protein n=1 Tax=Tropicibacter alexandrii TaxID=2267683 RepID=UPI000EF49049|nr:pyrroline-5-carboxylate reductase dimerization domain-containing protein [Tropicibacter alexandrii]
MSISRIGIVGSGMLGDAIIRAWLDTGAVSRNTLRVANRSGTAPVPGISITTIAKDLAQTCDTILLCIPPEQIRALDLHAPDALILSVMAGVSRAELTRATGSPRVVRAISSPAAALQLAYTPWIASEAVTEADRKEAERLFAALGKTDEVTQEDHIDLFTALTGPVPGFVAWFAATLAEHARGEGIAEPIVDRAIRQLFLSAGTMLGQGSQTAEDHVTGMKAYGGTTAAGLHHLDAGDLRQRIASGLGVSAEAARTILDRPAPARAQT